MPLLIIFLVLSALPLVSMPSLVICDSGQRAQTTENFINVCEDCPSGTFMNLRSHRLTQCFNCSQCPAGRFIGRECNKTSNTVCCPMSNMTVFDTEVGPYCAIQADEHPANCTAAYNNTSQSSNSGGFQNRSESVGVSKADTDYVRRFDYILAITVIAFLILFHKSRHTRTRREWVFVISVICILAVVCAMFFVFEDVTNDFLFMTCMVLLVIYCTAEIYRRKLQSCLNCLFMCFKSCIVKPRNVAPILPIAQNTLDRSQDENDVPDCQPSDPLIDGDTASYTFSRITDEPVPGVIAGSTSSNLNEEPEPGVIAGSTFSNLTEEPEPGVIAGSTFSNLTEKPEPGVIAGSTSSNLTEEPEPDVIVGSTFSNLTEEPEPGVTAGKHKYTSFSAEVGDNPYDRTIDCEASGNRPASHRVVAPEQIRQTGGSGDCCSEKAGESGRSHGADADDDNTKLSDDLLGVKKRQD